MMSGKPSIVASSAAQTLEVDSTKANAAFGTILELSKTDYQIRGSVDHEKLCAMLREYFVRPDPILLLIATRMCRVWSAHEMRIALRCMISDRFHGDVKLRISWALRTMVLGDSLLSHEDVEKLRDLLRECLEHVNAFDEEQVKANMQYFYARLLSKHGRVLLSKRERAYEWPILELENLPGDLGRLDYMVEFLNSCSGALDYLREATSDTFILEHFDQVVKAFDQPILLEKIAEVALSLWDEKSFRASLLANSELKVKLELGARWDQNKCAAVMLRKISKGL